MTFAVGFTWISETLLAFIHMAENAIHLYEFVEELCTMPLRTKSRLPLPGSIILPEQQQSPSATVPLSV